MMNVLTFLLPVFSALANPNVCEIKKETKDGGYQEFTVRDNVLKDVDSYRVLEHYVFFATSPVYGKPELGVINCSDGKKQTVVNAKNIVDGYPDGADFFRINEVKKIKDSFQISYYYSENVDKQNFKKFEVKRNLKKAFFKK